MELGQAKDREIFERSTAFYSIGRSGGEPGLKYLERIKNTETDGKLLKAASEAMSARQIVGHARSVIVIQGFPIRFALSKLIPHD